MLSEKRRKELHRNCSFCRGSGHYNEPGYPPCRGDLHVEYLVAAKDESDLARRQGQISEAKAEMRKVRVMAYGREAVEENENFEAMIAGRMAQDCPDKE
jgi:hypothetical protein